MSSSLLRKVYQSLIQTLGILISRSGSQGTDTPYGEPEDPPGTLNKRSLWFLIILALMFLVCLGMISGLMPERLLQAGLERFRIGIWSQDMAQELSRKAYAGTSMRSRIGQLSSRIDSHMTGLELGPSTQDLTQTIESDPPGSLQFPSPRRDRGLSALNRWLTNGSNRGSGGGWSRELRRLP